MDGPAAAVDLEHRLETEKQQNAQFQGSSSASGAASDPDVTDLVDTGRQEQLPPPHIVEELCAEPRRRHQIQAPLADPWAAEPTFTSRAYISKVPCCTSHVT